MNARNKSLWFKSKVKALRWLEEKEYEEITKNKKSIPKYDIQILVENFPAISHVKSKPMHKEGRKVLIFAPKYK